AFVLEGEMNDVSGLCNEFMTRIAVRLKANGAQIAHLKLWAQDETELLKLSVVRNDDSVRIEADEQPPAIWSSKYVHVWLNARLQIEAELLKEQFLAAIGWLQSELQLDVTVNELECFAPAPPAPVHRLA